MAASRLDGPPPAGPDWQFERKLDGFRCLATVTTDGVALRSRNDLALEQAVPTVVADLRAAVAGEVVLDGELVAFDAQERTSFSLLQRRLGSRSAVAPTPAKGADVYYCAFDLLWCDGVDLRDRPLVERQARLAEAVAFGGTILPVPSVQGDGADLLAAACTLGWEGLVAKRRASRYQGRRSRDWLKLTCTRAQELAVGGYVPLKGAGTGVGALLVGYLEDGRLRYAGKVGTGFTEAGRRELADRLDAAARPTSPFADPVREPGARWAEPELVVQVAFEEWTEAGRLRHPRYLGPRPDKAVADVRREEPPRPRP
jgi:bifunctional non-homologous end joining protein LigD